VKVSCPFCGEESADELIAEDRNRALSDERFPYRRCQQCRTIFIEQIPTDLGRYYPEDAYAIPTGRQRELAVAAERWRVELLRRFVEPGRLVEVGPGFGLFANAAVEAGFKVSVIDMDAHVTERLGSRPGITAITSDKPAEVLRGLPPSQVIALWHTIEHLPDPAGMLASAAENLEPGGLLALAAPNPSSLQFRLLGARWLHLDAPRHLRLIPARALLERARQLGLRQLAMTTSDPTGLQCNRSGWQWAGRPPLAQHRPSRAWTLFTGVLNRALRPIERRGCNGSTYTVVFEKPRIDREERIVSERDGSYSDSLA
jgi:2-polyprenyl-3-methyl-5-hydroxy-6-metoxy-1,4-benzoquinol methylase